MPMNIVIQEKRRELGLTQEQIAQHLGVSTPAVSKWEKGITCPDIALLPSLARLLKVDLNTLFCFQEELTMQEIRDFCKELSVTADGKGIAAAFDQAEEMFRSYPHNESLIQLAALCLDGMLRISELPEEEIAALEGRIEKWYQGLTESADLQIRNLANYMLASRYIDRGSLEKAQDTLDAMPDKNDMIAKYADKLFLQVNIHMKQGRADAAAEELEQALLIAVNKVQLLLLKLAEAEQAAGERSKAAHIVKCNQDMVKLFDLWECSAYTAALSLAAEAGNKEETLSLLQKVLDTATQPWNMAASPLYHRIAGTEKKVMDQGLMAGLLRNIRQDAQYDFLRDDARFQGIMGKYESLLALEVESADLQQR